MNLETINHTSEDGLAFGWDAVHPIDYEKLNKYIRI